MSDLTFWQQFAMALAHGGPPSIVAFFAYLKLRKRHDTHHKQVVVMLNGGLEKRIADAVKAALDADKVK